jgi:hypothetical protein
MSCCDVTSRHILLPRSRKNAHQLQHAIAFYLSLVFLRFPFQCFFGSFFRLFSRAFMCSCSHVLVLISSGRVLDEQVHGGWGRAPSVQGSGSRCPPPSPRPKVLACSRMKGFACLLTHEGVYTNYVFAHEGVYLLAHA